MQESKQSIKNKLNLFGEFYVASQLYKRGLFCNVTYGNFKSVDILFYKEDATNFQKVEVKTSSSGRFVTSFYQKFKKLNTMHPDFWILVHDIKNQDCPDVYILTHEEVAKEQAIRNKVSELTWEEAAQKAVKGVDNILAKDLQAYKSKWEKLSNNI